jgi:hypothetical protein
VWQDSFCCKNQEAYRAWEAMKGATKVLKGWETKVEEEAVEERNKNEDDNEWGITCDDDDHVDPAAAGAQGADSRMPKQDANLPQGVQFAYAAPAGACKDDDTVQVCEVS